MNGKRCVCAGFALGLALWAGNACATSIIPKTFAQVCEDAVAIIKGEVTSSEVRQDPVNGGIYSHYVVTVKEAIKGDVGETVQFRVLGGRLGDRVCNVPGLLLLEQGQTYILALRQGYETLAEPYEGVNQGWFAVITDPSTGQEAVLNGDGNVVLGVENGELKVRFGEVGRTKAEVLGAQGVAVDAGQSSDGAPVTMSSGEARLRSYWDTTQVGMDVKAFVAAIRNELNQSAANQGGNQ